MLIKNSYFTTYESWCKFILFSMLKFVSFFKIYIFKTITYISYIYSVNKYWINVRKYILFILYIYLYIYIYSSPCGHKNEKQQNNQSWLAGIVIDYIMTWTTVYSKPKFLYFHWPTHFEGKVYLSITQAARFGRVKHDVFNNEH